jgi:hypothetical protein
MAAGVVRYSVGNENNPADPWGRSELVVQPDGSARLDHHFPCGARAGTWTGQVDSAALAALRAALERAGFPAVPPHQPVAGATLRWLAVEAGGVREVAAVGWHQAPALPGYAEAFDLLDAMIRQLSGETVRYPTTQPAIVRDVAAQEVGGSG